AGLHRQDAVFLLHQPGRQGLALGLHDSGARGAAVGRRRVRGGDLRRNPHHAGPAARAVRRFNRRRRRRQDRRPVLKNPPFVPSPDRASGSSGQALPRETPLARACAECCYPPIFASRERSMIKFYYNGAPNPMKVALMLEETGLPYEPVPVDGRKGEQHKPEYLAINPNAKVPSIVDGDTTVFDSNAILLYLG